MGFMAWTKIEGIYILIVNVIVLLLYQLLSLYKKKENIGRISRSIIVLFLPGFFIYLPWLIFININNYSPEYIHNVFNILNVQKTISNLYIFIWRSSIFIVNPVKWGVIFWFTFYIFIFLNLKFLKKEKNFFLLLLIVAHYLLYVFVYLINPSNPRVHIGNSYERMLLHITPMCCYLIGILILNNKKLLLEFNEDSFHRYLLIIFGLGLILSIILILLFHSYFLSFLKEYLPYYGIENM
jgi:hypothetical protein